ncbi:MBL fold metallo-hydrolase [Clostridium sp. 19966]|uniref:MBL fold metallo-hydrolase n=1 Tax=Clostridium sp. 19966 TaxID=2768166 RepID=UPI0028DEB080|nr:MBL fold metallo-hydrolase [Clostridium sp. 19966]MDT8717220.1 MBL fold metallo-hydrolase [Clostridium sp. 19966]
MELTKIKGNTYYINAPTNIGVYSYKNKNCLLIDTGRNNSAARKIEEVLKENGLHVKYIINTHSHMDHCGGNNYFKNEYTGCITYASSKEKIYMENIELHPSILYSSFPVKQLQEEGSNIEVDIVPEYGVNKINDEKIEVIPLKGHSPEHIGIITPEKVCFLGDSIFSSDILEKYSLPFLYNVQDQFKTLEAIKEIEADYFVISHAKDIVNKEEIIDLADRNIENIQNYLNDIYELLEKPLTKEELLENIVIINDISLNYRQYHLDYSSVSALLKYLIEKGKVESSIENGKLYYYAVQ